MKVTSVELHPDGSDAYCVLSFQDPTRSNPYNVKGITGLDADEIVSRFYGVQGADALYNLVPVKKEISALVELNPDYSLGQTPATLRDDLYRMIASSRKGKIDIWFKNGETVVATISGGIQKLEASHFAKSPEVQITIKCKEPFLKAPEPVSLSVVGLDPALTVIEDNLSTAPHGFKFEMEFTTTVPSINIVDPDEVDGWSFEVIPWTPFVNGDVLHFSSEFNDKYLYVVRTGTGAIEHLADVISHGSQWPLIFPMRENKFNVGAGSEMDWVSITHFPTYWGI